ncbi:MAG TPA: hypothetical protein VHS58_18635 [Acetobacteraceae bacterium]|nr:hypothetical protein [Acetobacteraceae bacterium]
MRLRDLADRLARLDLGAVVQEALAREAGAMANAVRDALAGAPGHAHDAPWERTGALHASIGSDADTSRAVIGSSDPVAVYQELGTARVPPRPFLAPVGAEHGAAAADAVGAAVVAAIGGA